MGGRRYRYEYRNAAGVLCCGTDSADGPLCDECVARRTAGPDGYAAALARRGDRVPSLPPDLRTGTDVYLDPPDGYKLALLRRALKPADSREGGLR